MSLWLGVLLGVLGLGSAVALVVYYLRNSAVNAADLSLANSALQLERDRAAAIDAAAVADRARRASELDEKAASVRTAGDAAGLLRDVTGAGAPKA